jgi:bifunctional N-acetylglucosamine-1-phosphate-uridyltransferase/glucosamine-1-phosphate-acetyltransferase GlmU-like protein
MAGKGSRFSDQGYEQPKPLINVNGKPMIIQAVDCLPTTSNKIFICAEEQINKYNVDQILINHFPNTSVVSVKKTTQGQACTCELGLIQSNFDLNKPILISACDNGVLYNAENYQKLIDDDSIDVIVWTFRNNQTSKVKPNMYSWVDVDTHNKVQFVSCKKFVHEDPLKTHAIIGTFFYKKAKDFLDGLKANYKENIRTGGEFYVDDVVNQNVKGGLNVVVFEVDNYICWGTPDDYKTYNYWREYFLK